MPSLAVGDTLQPVLHVSQIAEALGLAPPPSSHPLRDGRDAAAVLGAWLSELRSVGWDTLLLPTRSRGRSLRNLTVNVFRPFELLPEAWTTAEFDWRPERDDLLERQLPDRDALLGYAQSAADGWRRFLDDHGAELDTRDPPTSSPRGRLPFSSLLAFQRWHAAYHYRQLTATLGRGPMPLDSLPDLRLPDEIF